MSAFGSSTFRHIISAPHVSSGGGYRAAHVLSPKQFSNSGTQVRERISIGSTRISLSGHGAKFSVGGAGFRFSSSGRITHRTTIENG